LLAVGACCAFGTAGASAALPELGRCVKAVPGATGAYIGKGCVKTSPSHTGSYEFEPGPGEKPGFEAIGISEVLLETVGGVSVKCAVSEIVGKWTGAKTASVNLAFHGCADQKKRACTTPEVGSQKETEIKTEPALEGEIGYISGKGTEKPVVGMDLKSSNNALPMLTFTCTKLPAEPDPEPTTWNIEGSLIAQLKMSSMKTTGKAVVRATKGKQIPEKLEEGVTDVPIAKYGFPTPSTTEQAGITLVEEPKHNPIATESEEPLLIKAK
jgi:hypothetical protein